MASRPERVVLTYEDLLGLPEDRNRYELYEGELEVTAAPNLRHQDTVGNLYAILRPHVRERGLGRLFVAPIDVRLSDITVVEPDLVFVSAARVEILHEQFIAGPPDLVIEILSPTTASRDLRTKRSLYARHGVRYYWHFDPEHRVAEALELVGERYRVAARASGDEPFSAPPFSDLIIDLRDVWETTY